MQSNCAYLPSFCRISHSSHASILSILLSTVMALREPCMSMSNALLFFLVLLEADAEAGVRSGVRTPDWVAEVRTACRRDGSTDCFAGDDAAAGDVAASEMLMTGAPTLTELFTAGALATNDGCVGAAERNQ
jgi:hypothetical protein